MATLSGMHVNEPHSVDHRSHTANATEVALFPGEARDVSLLVLAGTGDGLEGRDRAGEPRADQPVLLRLDHHHLLCNGRLGSLQATMRIPKGSAQPLLCWCIQYCVFANDIVCTDLLWNALALYGDAVAYMYCPHPF